MNCSRKEHRVPVTDRLPGRGEECTRRVCIAVAGWLCGTLEGLSDNASDRTVAEVLDAWLRIQKHRSEVFYTGHVVCPQCSTSWEAQIVGGVNSACCPCCGSTVELHHLLPKRTYGPGLSDVNALTALRMEFTGILQRINSLCDMKSAKREGGDTG